MILVFFLTWVDKKILDKAETAGKDYQGSALLKLIRNGENSKLEFKSTLRWNIKTNRPGKEIEISWLKTVAAFMNTDSGIILIGVEDNGNILGISPDQFPNEDKYLLHFNNLINQHIGLEFSRFLSYKLHSVKDKRILNISGQYISDLCFIKQNKPIKGFPSVGTDRPCFKMHSY